MLDFHIGTGGIENPGEYLGSLAIDEILWLRKNGFLVEGDIGQNGDLAETLSYFDDTILTAEQVVHMHMKFRYRFDEAIATAGFSSSAVNKLDEIFSRAIKVNRGLTIISD